MPLIQILTRLFGKDAGRTNDDNSLWPRVQNMWECEGERSRIGSAKDRCRLSNLIVFGTGQVRNRPMRAALFGPGNRNNGLLFLEQTRKNEAPDRTPHPEQNSLLTDGNNLK